MLLCLSVIACFFTINRVEGDSPGDWWPMFGHDLTGARYSTSTAPMSSTVTWSYTTGGAVRSAATIADGISLRGNIRRLFLCSQRDYRSHNLDTQHRR